MSQNKITSHSAEEERAGETTRASAELERLAQAQGVKPVADLDELAGDFWPEDESIDEFLSAVQEWRHIPSKRSID